MSRVSRTDGLIYLHRVVVRFQVNAESRRRSASPDRYFIVPVSYFSSLCFVVRALQFSDQLEDISEGGAWLATMDAPARNKQSVNAKICKSLSF